MGAPAIDHQAAHDNDGRARRPERLWDDPVLRRGLIGSACLHAALLAFFTLRAVIYPSEPIQMERAIRVDMVGLPTKQKPVISPEPAAPAKPEPAKPEPAAKPPPPAEKTKALPKAVEPNKINLHAAKKDQADALKRLEALEKIEKMRKQNEASTAKPSAPLAPVRGNEIAHGNSLTGLSKVDYDGYLDSLDAQVKKHWALPEWLANANLKAQIVVWIDARGNVVKKSMARSSGNAVYDQKAMDSIDRASPFPPPPPRLATIFAVDGVVLGFPE